MRNDLIINTQFYHTHMSKCINILIIKAYINIYIMHMHMIYKHPQTENI